MYSGGEKGNGREHNGEKEVAKREREEGNEREREEERRKGTQQSVMLTNSKSATKAAVIAVLPFATYPGVSLHRSRESTSVSTDAERRPRTQRVSGFPGTSTTRAAAARGKLRAGRHGRPCP